MKEKIGQKFGQLKEAAGKLSDKTKKLIIAGVVVLIAGAVIIALVLNNRPYGSLFTGLGQEEAQQITKKLQEDGIDFKFGNPGKKGYSGSDEGISCTGRLSEKRIYI